MEFFYRETSVSFGFRMMEDFFVFTLLIQFHMRVILTWNKLELDMFSCYLIRMEIKSSTQLPAVPDS